MCDNLIAWIDVESTGLNPDRDYLLEIGVILTKVDGEILYKNEFLVENKINVKELQIVSNSKVIQMHNESGLWEDLTYKEKRDCGSIDDSLHKGIVDAIATKTKCYDRKCLKEPTIWFGGNSVTLDRAYVKNKFPKFNSLLSHRSLDMTSVNFFIASALYSETYYKTSKHRAFSDAKDSLEEYLAMRDLIRGF